MRFALVILSATFAWMVARVVVERRRWPFDEANSEFLAQASLTVARNPW